MVSPYGGWTSINSFLDHDYPDYNQDGTIVLANGLRAVASDGTESDTFPAYWSPTLRQYVNYDGHNGYDFGISYQPVLAAAAGRIAYAGWDGGPYDGYGQMIIIKHRDGYATLYGHLSELDVHTGDSVSAGERIGISGSTGHSSGPHLHFSVFHNCQVVDPYGWTGSGGDPLYSFDHERSTYLWLPGQAPLVVNPPPNWPAYTGSVAVRVPGGIAAVSPRSIPPVDRLLLLHLPPPGTPTNPAAALARTDTVISSEWQTLRPYLEALHAEGLVDSYANLPGMGAIRVRGVADAGTLESLPGVASLSGVAAADLQNAQAGLAHAVLIQLGALQAPALWPVGFRSALHPWRPIITALAGHSLVQGVVLPGTAVSVQVVRRGRRVASGICISDQQTGGFVASLQDAHGNPTPLQQGDILTVRAGGRVAEVAVSAQRVVVDSQGLHGMAAPESSLHVSVFRPDGTTIADSIISAGVTGSYTMRVPHVDPGSTAVVSVLDAAGDQIASATAAPGMVVDLSSRRVSGWTDGPGAALELQRHGVAILKRRLNAAVDGSFSLPLPRVRPGDVLSLVAPGTRRVLVIPPLAMRRIAGALLLRDTAGAQIEVAARGHTSLLRLATSQQTRLPLSVSAARLVQAIQTTAGGDQIVATFEQASAVVHVGTSSVSGIVSPHATVLLRLRQRRTIVATAVAVADGRGRFRAVVRDALGLQVRIEPGMRLHLSSAAARLAVTVPTFEFHRLPSGANLHAAPGSLVGVQVGTSSRMMRVGASGILYIPAGHREIRAVLAEPDGIIFLRTKRAVPVPSRRPHGAR